jgi:hypothetical protein
MNNYSVLILGSAASGSFTWQLARLWTIILS